MQNLWTWRAELYIRRQSRAGQQALWLYPQVPGGGEGRRAKEEGGGEEEDDESTLYF
jgi:hypothetical protein